MTSSIGSGIIFQSTRLSQADWWILLIVALAAVAFVAFAIERVVNAHRRQATTGREDLIGKNAVVKRALKPMGMVMLRGELWEAVSEGDGAEVGQEVTIRRVDGLRLYVTKK